MKEGEASYLTGVNQLTGIFLWFPIAENNVEKDIRSIYRAYVPVVPTLV